MKRYKGIKRSVLCIVCIMTCLMTMPMYGYCEGGHAANNWSEYVPQYEVHFKTQPATCFNNAHVLYAVVDKNNPEVRGSPSML